MKHAIFLQSFPVATKLTQTHTDFAERGAEGAVGGEGSGDEGREGAGMIELTKMVATQFLCPRATLYLGKEKPQ